MMSVNSNMTIEDYVNRFELGSLRDAKLFYLTVKTILARIGFSHSYQHLFGISDRFVAVRKDFESFSRLLCKRSDLSDLRFVEVFEGPDLSRVKVMTGYSDAADLRKNHFSYYAIGSTSDLGLGLPVKLRDRVLDVDKNTVAGHDFNEGFITKTGMNYWFTLTSLYNTSEASKPFLKPNFAYKC
jgi:hypothetical protein